MNLKQLADSLGAQMTALMECSHDDPEKFQREVERTRAVSDIGGRLIDTSKVALEATKLRSNYLAKSKMTIPALLDCNE